MTLRSIMHPDLFRQKIPKNPTTCLGPINENKVVEMEADTADRVMHTGFATEAEKIVIDDDDVEEEEVAEVKESLGDISSGGTLKSQEEPSTSLEHKFAVNNKNEDNERESDSMSRNNENNECQEVDRANFSEPKKPGSILQFTSRAACRPQCLSCFRSFSTRNEYVCHKLISCLSQNGGYLPKREAKIYFCDMCPLVFSTKSQLGSHVRYYCTAKPVLCTTCHHCFSSIRFLLRHKLFSPCVKRSLACPACLCRFKAFKNLKRHFDKMICEGVNVSSNNDLHEGLLTGRFRCPICGGIFSTENDLRVHAKDHMPTVSTASIITQCLLCGKRFSSEIARKYHKLFACPKKPHRCEFCLNRFTSRRRVISHQKLKCAGKEANNCTNVERYYLPDCDEKSTKIKIKKLRNLSNKCHLCFKHFDTEQELKNHGRFYCINMKYDCHLCNRRFTCQSGLTAHRVKHSNRPQRVLIGEIDLTV